MRLQLILRWHLGVLAVCACLGCLLPSQVRADEASGRWSGSLEGRANYFLERSTRVVMPNVGLNLESPGGLRIGVDYVVDVISSASIAQTGGEEDDVFHEVRQQVTLSLGKEFELDGTQLEVTPHGTFSSENDYRSWRGGVQGALSLNQRNTVLRLDVSRLEDTINSNIDDTFEKRLSSTSASGSLEQVLSPSVVLSLGYTFAYLEGFMANAYRRVLLGPLPFAEMHPERRLRHLGWAVLKLAFAEMDAALHFGYGAYVDSWGLGALKPNLDYFQMLGSHAMLKVRYRFYAQTSAEFQRDAYPAGWEGPRTNDPKLAAFHSHQVLGTFEFQPVFLAGTFLGFASDSWLDLGFGYNHNTTTFGNYITATAGGRLEF